MTLAELNALDRSEFVRRLGGVFEHSPWVADRAFDARPFSSIDALHGAMVAIVERASESEKLALLRAHPELAGRAAIRRKLTADSTHEQQGAGLDRCSPAEYARLHDLNARYSATFGFPFILAVKGFDRAGILREFARRIDNDRPTEFAEALTQVARIGRFRLEAILEA